MKTVTLPFPTRRGHHGSEEHIGRIELREILESGSLPQPSRRVVWHHFANRCAECRSKLAALAECRFRAPRANREIEPLVLTLRDLLVLESRRADGETLHLLWTWPSHLSALREVDSNPLGFVRLYLERVYIAMTDETPGKSLELAQQALADLTSSDALRFQGRRELRDLRALALARLSEAHTAMGEIESALRRLEEAQREFALGSGDAEAHSALEEAEAELLRRQGKPAQAYQALRCAALRLRSFPAARRAQTLVRQAAVLIELGEPRGALEVLAGAVDGIEKEGGHGRYDRLRFELDHWRAVALIEIGDFSAVISYLEDAGASYEDAEAPPLRKTQRQWMLGHALLRTEEINRARTCLEKAFEGYRALGMHQSMAHVLFERCRCALVRAQRGSLGDPFRELLGEPEMMVQSSRYWLEMLFEKLLKISELAKKHAIRSPSLHEKIAEIERLLGPPN